MTPEITHAIERIKSNAGASNEDIAILEHKLGMSLPDDYKEIVSRFNGFDGFIGDEYISLWSIHEVLDLNSILGVKKHFPGLLLIGSDGAEIRYGFNMASPGKPLVLVDFLGMRPDDVRVLAASLSEFLQLMIR